MGVVKQHNVKYSVFSTYTSNLVYKKRLRALSFPIIYSNHSYRPACFSFVYHPTPAKTSTRPAAVAHACSGAMGL